MCFLVFCCRFGWALRYKPNKCVRTHVRRHAREGKQDGLQRGLEGWGAGELVRVGEVSDEELCNVYVGVVCVNSSWVGACFFFCFFWSRVLGCMLVGRMRRRRGDWLD